MSTVVIQLVATTEVERASGRSRARKRRAAAATGSAGGSGALYRNAGGHGMRLALGVSPTVARGKPGAAIRGRLSL